MSDTPNETLPPEQTADVIGLALGTKAGDKFTLGGQERVRDFLRCDAEDDLADVLVDIIKRAPNLELAEVFMVCIRELRNAAVIILADYDEPDVEPAQVQAARERALTWIRTTRGVTNADLLELVLGQIAVNRLGALLGKLSTVSVPFAALRGQSRPATSPTSGSSAGSGSEPVSPSA